MRNAQVVILIMILCARERNYGTFVELVMVMSSDLDEKWGLKVRVFRGRKLGLMAGEKRKMLYMSFGVLLLHTESDNCETETN